MEVLYPDIIGEYIDMSERYQTGGIQYEGYFEPAQAAPNEVVHLYLFLQNTLKSSVSVAVKIHLSQGGGLFGGGKTLFQVKRAEFELEMGEAEAGLLTLPVVITEEAEAGENELTIELKVNTEGKPDRVHPPQSQSDLSRDLIDSPVGLNLVGVLGATYVEKPVKKAAFSIQVSGDPTLPPKSPNLSHTYETIWTTERLDTFNKAIREINHRRVNLNTELTETAIYATFFSESTQRFAQTGLPLRVGEAIILTKLLTFTAQYFLRSSKRFNGLLVPMWDLALQEGLDTTDVLDVMRDAGYYHLLKIAVAMGFGLIAKTTGKHHWPLVERQAVADFVATNVVMGEPIEADFLYLPLLMGGIQVASQLVMEGEDPGHSLALLAKASQARPNLFAEDEMAQAKRIYHHMLNKAMN